MWHETLVTLSLLSSDIPNSPSRVITSWKWPSSHARFRAPRPFFKCVHMSRPTYLNSCVEGQHHQRWWVGGWCDFSDLMYDFAPVSTVLVGHTYQWRPYHMRLCLHFVMLSLSLDTFCNATIFSCRHFCLALWYDFLYVSECGIPDTFSEWCD